MENKINIAELLKDCPKGMALDCSMFENLELNHIDKDDKVYPIKCRVKTEHGSYNYHSFNKYGCYGEEKYYKCVIFPKGKTTWEGFQRPFKDGDIAISDMGDIHLLSTKNSSYCAYRERWEGLPKFDSTITTYVTVVRLATEEEKQKLFNAIKANGYKWNPETKTLEKLIEPKFKVGDKIIHKVNKNSPFTITKITDTSYKGGYRYEVLIEQQDNFELVPNKFDITILNHFDKVLVRDNDRQEWSISLFSHYDGLKNYKYSCLNGNGYAQCIPYEENKHLLGTTDDCDNYYKTW